MQYNPQGMLWHNGSPIIDNLYVDKNRSIIPKLEYFSEKQLIAFMNRLGWAEICSISTGGG